MMIFTLENPPVTHPAVNVCDGPAIICQINYDSVIASAVSIVLTIAFSLWIPEVLASSRWFSNS